MTPDFNNIRMPLKPTWRRYVKLFIANHNISIYRALEYETLSNIEFSGKVLDFGGGSKAHYVSALKTWIKNGEYQSINISQDMDPTYLISPGDTIPIKSGTFDMVLSINTLEHVYELQETLMELYRVIKPGGHIVLAVPFLYRVHGCPDDYNRPTSSWWSEFLHRININNVVIRPLVWDALTTGLSVTEGAGPFSKLRRIIIPLYGLLYARLRTERANERYPLNVGLGLSNLALGYVITGTKI